MFIPASERVDTRAMDRAQHGIAPLNGPRSGRALVSKKDEQEV